MIELRRTDGRPWRIGHRGAAALAPENTLEGFARAIELGVEMVELDVVPLADGTLVIAHSDRLAEASHGAVRGRFGRSTLTELRVLAPTLATFDEALAFVGRCSPAIAIQVDLKRPGSEAAVVSALRRHGVLERTVVTSFFRRSLAALSPIEPALAFGLAYPLDRASLSRLRPLAPAVFAALVSLRLVLPGRIGRWLDATGAKVAALHHLLVSRAVLERCHRRGVAVFAWTVDDERGAARLAALGADGIVTNDPRIFSDLSAPPVDTLMP